MRIKEYISYSQYQLFNSSKKWFIKTYIEGVKFSNDYFDFGKMIANGLKDRKEKTNNSDIILARKLIKEPKEREKEIKVEFGKIPLFGFVDGYNPSSIEEYKTGKDKWTQEMVDKDEQLTWYAILISEKLKIPIDKLKITLKWLPTFEDIDDSIHLTGQIETFKTIRTELDKIKIYPKIKRAWLGIEKLIDDLI